MNKNAWNLWSVIIVTVAVVASVHAYGPQDGKIVRKVPTTHKVVAFTFDDGPHPGTTPELLALLKEKEVKATFFILGRNGETNLALLKEVIAAGHEIGNHGYSHQFLRQMGMDRYLADVKRNEDLLNQFGVKTNLFRPPGGGYNDNLVATLQQKGYTTVMWSVDTRDWSRPAVDQVVKVATDHLEPGAIFLFHDGQHDLPTVKAVRILIDRFREQGYSIVTVGDLLLYEEMRH